MKTKGTWTWLDTMAACFHIELVYRFVRHHEGRRGVRHLARRLSAEITRLEAQCQEAH